MGEIKNNFSIKDINKEIFDNVRKTIDEASSRIKSNMETIDFSNVDNTSDAGDLNIGQASDDKLKANIMNDISSRISEITNITEDIKKDNYALVKDIKTENGHIVVANQDGQNSKIYLFDTNGVSMGSVIIDSTDITDATYNENTNSVTIIDSKGNENIYSSNRINASINLAQKYENSNVGKYYATDGEKVIDVAANEIGKPYVWGSAGPDGYDCSGLVAYCLTGRHERIGTTHTFMEWPQTDNPQPGDVCVNPQHTGIYIGDGQMIHASDYGTGVIIGPVQDGMIYVTYPGE